MTGTAAVTIDISLPAIPVMSAAFGVDITYGQWIVGLFMAGMAVGQIPAGLFSDRYGRWPVLYIGTGLFLLTAIVAAVADNITVMLVARFMQGVGGAAAIVLARAIIRDVVSGRDAARLMSLVTMIFTAAPIFAPSIGAALMAVWGWRSPMVAIAVFALIMLVSIRLNLPETREPAPRTHPLAQLRSSIEEFFSHRQSIFGLLFLILPPIGFMSIIATSSSLAVETYGLSLQTFGFLFLGFGTSVLAGSTISRLLVDRLGSIRLIQLAVAAMAVAGAQFVAMVIMNDAPLWWLWSSVCLFMVSVGVLAPNATVLALDPLPKVAGVASSILGTSQNITGAFGALTAAWLYTGTVRDSVILITVSALATTTVFLCKPLLCPRITVHAAPRT